MVGSFFVGCKIGGTWMQTIFAALAVMIAAPSAAWESSYSQGQKQAAAQQKPLVVVFAPGSNAWTKVVKGENPSLDVGKLLAESYVCVFVDTATDSGKQLATNFALQADKGLVVSDRAGGTQAFWHQGDMTNDQMLHYLGKYADPNVVVQRTETVNAPRSSFYPFNYVQPATRTISSGNC
jgi:hypothetical protein